MSVSSKTGVPVVQVAIIAIISLIVGLGACFIIIYLPAVNDLHTEGEAVKAELIDTQQALASAISEIDRLDRLRTNPPIELIEIQPFMEWSHGEGLEICGRKLRADDGRISFEYPNELGATANVSFTLVNSGSIDGFTIVEMTARAGPTEIVVASNQYFVSGDSNQRQTLTASSLPCRIHIEDVTVRIARELPG